MSNLREKRSSSILWRVVFGIVALIAIAGGGAWLMDAGIDHSLEAQAAEEGASPPSE